MSELPPIPPGGLPFGSCLLERHLSRGGMADVWLARDAHERRVVIKRIRSETARDPEFVSLFQREAAIAMKLAHGNVARVFEFGEVGGEYFLTMEWIDGPTLLEAVQAASEAGQGVPFPVAVHVMAAVARGLEHAHRLIDDEGQAMGIVHRDVSPANIILTFEGEVKLVDFGIARGRTSERLTRPGVARGKYVYFAPEQVRDEVLDGRTDVYACGVVLYRLLTGRLPFEGPQVVDVLQKIVAGQVAAPRLLEPAIPPSLEAIVLLAMAADRRQRPQRAHELEADLVAWLRAEAPQMNENVLAAWVQGLFPQRLVDSGPVVTRARGAGKMLRTWSRPRPLAASISQEAPTSPDALDAPSQTTIAGPRVRRRPKWAAAAVLLATGLLAAALTLAGREAPPAFLSVESTPPGASVLLDGQDTGQVTPAKIPGVATDRTYGVTLAKAGFRSWMGSARVSAPLQVALEPVETAPAPPAPEEAAPEAEPLSERLFRLPLRSVGIPVHRTPLAFQPLAADRPHRVTLAIKDAAHLDTSAPVLWYAMRPGAPDLSGVVALEREPVALALPEGVSGLGLATVHTATHEPTATGIVVRIDGRAGEEVDGWGNRLGLHVRRLPKVPVDPERSWRVTVRIVGEIPEDSVPRILWAAELGETHGAAGLRERYPHRPNEVVGTVEDGGSFELPLASRVYLLIVGTQFEDPEGVLEIHLQDLGPSQAEALRRR